MIARCIHRCRRAEKSLRPLCTQGEPIFATPEQMLERELWTLRWQFPEKRDGKCAHSYFFTLPDDPFTIPFDSFGSLSCLLEFIQ